MSWPSAEIAPLLALAAAIAAGLALSVCLALWLALRVQRRRLAASEAQLAALALQLDERAQALAALDERFAQLGAGELGAGRRLSRAQQELVALRNRVDDLESAQQRSAPYDTAIRMAESGAGVDGVMDACGLSEAEAELLFKLHSAQLRR
mgnify:CR=1 FL=1